EDAIREAVEGADAVISALGPPIDPFVRGTPLTDGTRRIVAAMHATGVRLLDRLVPIGIGLLIPGALREVQGISEVVATSELDWTVARIFAPIDVPANHTVRAGFLGRDSVG